MNMQAYFGLLFISSMFLGFVSSGQIYIRLADLRWGGSHPFPYLVSGCLGAIIMFFVSGAAIDKLGIIGGIVSVLGSIPLIGISWIFVICGNLALERVLSQLIRKFD